MSFGGLAFLNPALLAGLAALPLIWWLLRAVPPAPRRVAFPATRILVGLENRDKQSERTPWWLTLIRLLAAAALIFALAEPVLNPERKVQLAGTGPVAIVVDNGWSSASRWSERRSEIDRRITEAEASGRSVVIVPTASINKSQPPRIEAPAQARSTAAALEPQPFAPDRVRAAELLSTALGAAAGASVLWLTDGIDHDGGAIKFADTLIAAARGGTALAIETAPGNEALGLSAGLGQGGRLEATLLRASGPEIRGRIVALNTRGQRL
ncbi:MAG: BatA domain-containing protein, partial [Hyphomicrobiaceae bacterium]